MTTHRRPITLPRLLPAILWISVIYLASTLAADLDPTPQEFWLRMGFEARHVVQHLVAFILETVLILNALPEDQRTGTRILIIMIGLMALLGIGQEAIQTFHRGTIKAGPS